MAESKITFDVDIAIKEQTAKFAVDVLNLYLKSNPDKIPFLDFHEDPDGSKYISISIENKTAKPTPEVNDDHDRPVFLNKKMNLPADQDQKNEDPETMPHWKAQYFDNKPGPLLFQCSKCGYIDTIKRAACLGCGRDMKID